MILIILLIAFVVWANGLWKNYRAKNIRQLTILIIVPLTISLIATIVFTLMSYNYPTEWNQQILGEKRNHVHRQLEKPTAGELWDVKGDIWIKEKFYSWHRLDVMYDTDTICRDYTIAYYIGSKTHFIKLNLKSSFE
jgi:hypothetical protein